MVTKEMRYRDAYVCVWGQGKHTTQNQTIEFRKHRVALAMKDILYNNKESDEARGRNR